MTFSDSEPNLSVRSVIDFVHPFDTLIAITSAINHSMVRRNTWRDSLSLSVSFSPQMIRLTTRPPSAAFLCASAFRVINEFPFVYGIPLNAIDRRQCQYTRFRFRLFSSAGDVTRNGQRSDAFGQEVVSFYFIFPLAVRQKQLTFIGT